MFDVYISIGLFSPNGLGGQHESHDEEVARALSQEDPLLG